MDTISSFKLFDNKKIHLLLFIFFIITISIISFLLIRNKNPIIDENVHLKQIEAFNNHEITLHPKLTTIPGYHIIISSIAQVFHTSSISSIRLISLFINLISIFIFYKLAKIFSNDPILKTMHYYLMPILFPFFFLIYTDILAITLTLASLLLIKKKEYIVSGLLAFLSILIRQNNIIWVLFLYILIYLENNGKNFKWDNIKNHIKTYWAYNLALIFFMIFLIINNGVALNEKDMHPSFQIHFGNLYFMLFIFFIIFLPSNILEVRSVVKKIKNKKILFFILIFFLFYILTFHNSHIYNQDNFLLKSRILNLFNSSILLKSIFFFPVAYSVLFLTSSKFIKNYKYIIYIFGIASVLPSWLIEIRYYLMPFILFILFREKISPINKYATITYYCVLNIILFFGIINDKFFL